MRLLVSGNLVIQRPSSEHGQMSSGWNRRNFLIFFWCTEFRRVPQVPCCAFWVDSCHVNLWSQWHTVSQMLLLWVWTKGIPLWMHFCCCQWGSQTCWCGYLLAKAILCSALDWQPRSWQGIWQTGWEWESWSDASCKFCSSIPCWSCSCRMHDMSKEEVFWVDVATWNSRKTAPRCHLGDRGTRCFHCQCKHLCVWCLQCHCWDSPGHYECVCFGVGQFKKWLQKWHPCDGSSNAKMNSDCIFPTAS